MKQLANGTVAFIKVIGKVSVKRKRKKALIPSVKPKTGKMNLYIKPLLIAL